MRDPYNRSRVRPPLTPLPIADLELFAASWMGDGEIAGLSPGTLYHRRLFVDQLLWWCRREGVAAVADAELRRYFLYLRHGHEEEGGRWGTGWKKPPRPATMKTWHGYLGSFFSYVAEQGGIEESPMLRLPVPRLPRDQVQPLTPDQIDALLEAARRSKYRRRDEALILFLLDTGARASEAISIRFGDLQLAARQVYVTGKGNKRRLICFGPTTGKALWSYCRSTPHEPDEPLFLSERHAALTPSGLKRCVLRLGKAAGIAGVRCTPHTLRHTFALTFVQAGGEAFRLQLLLGHTTLEMSRRYTKLGEADLARAHREFSPVEYLRRK